jgi:predicted RNA-binding protein YlqC (UPF0109 family)
VVGAQEKAILTKLEGDSGVAIPGFGAGGSIASMSGSNTGRPGATQIFVPAAHIGLVIGRGGETIRRLQDQSGASIQVAREPSGNGEYSARVYFTISQARTPLGLTNLHPRATGAAEPPGTKLVEVAGDPNCVASAKTMIEELIRSAEMGRSASGYGMGPGTPGMTQDKANEVFEVAQMYVGGIIGRAGSTIQRIQQESVRRHRT